MKALESGRNLKEVCGEDSRISDVFDNNELSRLFSPASHLGVSEDIVENAVSLAREAIGQ